MIKHVFPAYICGNSKVGIVVEEYRGDSKCMWVLDLLRLRQVASSHWRIPLKPCLVYNCICCEKRSPLNGVTDMQVRASWRRTSEVFYFGGFGLSLEKKWMEEKTGNKQTKKQELILQLKPETRRNVFIKLDLIASCLFSFRALGNRDSVWAGQGLITQKWKHWKRLSGFLPKTKVKIFAKGATRLSWDANGWIRC